MFAYRDTVGPVEVAVTDRHGGVSTGAWGSLNLGTSNGDDPDTVARNLTSLAAGLGVDAGSVVRMSQMHGRDVHLADGTDDMSRAVPRADALVTATPGVTLLVRVADCVPLVLADPGRGVVAVVHAGRVGMTLGVCAAAVGVMRDLGADRIRAWLGPRACGRCYEVPEAMRAEVCQVVPQAWSTTSWGTPALDVGAGAIAQLHACNVEVAWDVADLDDRSAACTIENTDYFSYRRQGQSSGRFGALVRIRP